MILYHKKGSLRKKQPFDFQSMILFFYNAVIRIATIAETAHLGQNLPIT
jgi:hypothetical protein